ncbi:MAG: homoserine kinase [bacterium]
MKATAFAPATVANVGPGFDILGFAVAGRGDEVTVATRQEAGISVQMHGPGSEVISTDPAQNTATAGLLQLLADHSLHHGLQVNITKGIPIGSGLGGSAASAVGGIVAANAALGLGLSNHDMLRYALIGESVASGDAHPDNAAPCLWGGFTFAKVLSHGIEVRALPLLPELHVVLVHPSVRVDTRMARQVLPDAFERGLVVQQTANLTRMVCAAYEGDWEGFADACEDVLVQPYRSSLIPHFDAVRNAALGNGALSFSISGSGPTMFALATAEHAEGVRAACAGVFDGLVDVQSFVSPLGAPGARIIA